MRDHKESKLKWFGNIPCNWKEGKISYYFKIGRGRVISELELDPDGKYPVYSSQTKNNGCLGYINTYDFDAEMLTWTTDGANAGSVFLRTGKFNCTNVCGTLIPRKGLNLEFYHYYLSFTTQFYKRPDTNGAKIMNNEMAKIYCLIPPTDEQTQIAKYLDYQTNIIDRLIEKKEKLVILLQEQRQAIIHEAVTKGLDPTAKMKDSGIEWLGEIPEEWDLIPIRYLTSKIGSGVTPKGGADVYVDEGVIFIRSQNVHFDGLRLDKVSHINIETHENMSNSKIQKDDVLLNITGASIGRSCIVDIDAEMNVNQHVCILRCNEKVNYKYLNLLLQSNIGQTLIKLGTTGGNREGLTFEAIKKFVVPIPAIKAQQETIKRLTESIFNFENIMSKTESQISKLKEYRQSIISEAVTGKIDLREWEEPKKEIA